jgi:CRP/FNR family transcriptional regulator, cyclic AMP receptor protein
MSETKAIVKVIGTEACPLYLEGDEFKLSGKSLVAPYGKASCLILVRDITEVLLRYECIDASSRYVFDCSGCTGLARLEFRRERERIFPRSDERDLGALAETLGDYAFFRTFDEESVKEILGVLKVARFAPGQTILEKGEPGRNLYIVASGKVEVLAEDGIRIAVLGKGEVFGEMSLISGDPVAATVRAVEPIALLYLSGSFFRELLQRTPSIQIYLTRLLARRIANTNVIRVQDTASAMTGNLSEIPPAELFQTLNMNQKTGVLILKLEGGLAAASFRDGELIRAKFGDLLDREAFFAILAAREGRFKFSPELPPEETRTDPLGGFMSLLMEGVRRADEADAGPDG